MLKGLTDKQNRDGKAKAATSDVVLVPRLVSSCAWPYYCNHLRTLPVQDAKIRVKMAEIRDGNLS